MKATLIATEQEVLSFFRTAYSSRSRKYYGFFNSLFDRLIVDEHLMLLPMDDRTATRAHGVFDVVYVKKSKIINLESHIDRLFHSASTVCILPPYTKQQTKEKVIEVVKETIKFHSLGSSELGVRMTISSGFGDLGISSLNKKSILYIALFEPYIAYEKQKKGVNEFVVQYVDQPKALVHSKTIDYIENAMMANESQKKGGYQGIKALKTGVLLEAAMANIAFLFGKEFATPRLDTVVEGTTLKKLLVFIEQLKTEGIIENISFRDITVDEAQHATEMMVIGGDKIVPVLYFNGKLISEKRGPMAEKCQIWYQQMNESGIDVSDQE